VKATLTYGSVCSGMEAATLAFTPLGWRCAFVSEIDKAPSALLAQRYPDVPNRGDMTKFEEWPHEPIDLLVGGTPCQSFSVAGLRKGLADPRGNLMLTYGAIAKRLRPTWLLWENVPGVLSSNGGRDFGAFLGMLAELGYGFAYRVLDAQFFGLAQRRKRVFVVGHLGDWRAPAAVLFEPESLRGDSPPRRQSGQGFTFDVAPSLTGSGRGVERPGESRGQDPLVAHTLNAKGGGGRIDAESETFIAHSLRADGFDASEDGTGRGTPIIPILEVGKGTSSRGDGPNGCGIGEAGDPMFTLQAGAQHAVAQPYTLAIRGRGDSHDLEYRQDGVANAILTPNGGRAGIGVGAIAFDTYNQEITGDVAQTLCSRGDSPGGNAHLMPAIAYQTSGNCGAWETGDMVGAIDTMTDPNSHIVQTEWAVRRLTPRECERLQGANDDHTLITYRGKPAADGPRYKMIGNSFAVNCVRWIGERIQLVHVLKAVQSEKDSAR